MIAAETVDSFGCRLWSEFWRGTSIASRSVSILVIQVCSSVAFLV